MSSLRKMLEAKKEKILADAQERAAEIDRDMEQLERLTAKYNLSVAEPASNQEQSGRTMNLVDGIIAAQELYETIQKAVLHINNASITKRARVAAEAYIRAKNKPVPLNELFEVLKQNGIVFQSENPKNTLSAVLGQGQNLYSVSRDTGWWISGVELPKDPGQLWFRRQILEDQTNEAAAE